MNVRNYLCYLLITFLLFLGCILCSKRPHPDDCSELRGFEKRTCLEQARQDCYFKVERKGPFQTQPRPLYSKVNYGGCIDSDRHYKFEDLIKNQNAGHGSQNEADLVLSRGAAMFLNFLNSVDVDSIKNEVLCANHRRQLSIDWRKGKYNHFKDSRKGYLYCSVPLGIGLDDHADGKLRKGDNTLTVNMSLGVIYKTGIPLQPALPLCREHYEKFKGYEQEYHDRNLVITTTPLDDTPKVSSTESIESLSSESDNDAEFCISNNRKSKTSNDLPPKAIEGFAIAAKALGITSGRASKYDFELSARTLRHHQSSFNKGVYGWAQFISGNKFPEKLIQNSKLLGQCPVVKSTPLEKYFLDVRKQYQMASSSVLKVAIITNAADTMGLTELAKYIPEVKRSIYERAKKAARKIKNKQPLETKKRGVSIRYDDEECVKYVHFITKPSITTSMPTTGTAVTINGKQYNIPDAIRELRAADIISKYAVYHFEEYGVKHKISESSMRKILKVLGGRMRASRDVVDMYEAAGMDAIEDLLLIAQRMEIHQIVDKETRNELDILISEYSYFIRREYYSMLSYDSKCAELNILWALSISGKFQHDKLLKKDEYNLKCPKCGIIDSIYALIDSSTTDSDACFSVIQKNEILDYKIILHGVKFALSAWKNHIVRARHSNEARYELLNSLEDGEAFITIDFSQKFLPRNWNEKQSDYYGKAGLSWHISHIIANISGTRYTHTMVHVLGYAEQNSAAVNSVIFDTANFIKDKGIHTIIYRSDQASYYKNAALIYSLTKISDLTKVFIKRYSFSEVQAGKSTADAETSRMKMVIRSYLNSQHNVNSPEEMFDALKSNPRMKGYTIVLANGNPFKLNTISLTEIKSFTEFEFSRIPRSEKWMVKAFKSYNIGTGQLIYLSSTDTQEPRTFGPHDLKRTFTQNGDENSIWKQKLDIEELMSTRQKKPKQGAAGADSTVYDGFGDDKMFQCDVDDCDVEFFSFRRYEEHMRRGIHKFTVKRKTIQEIALETYTSDILGIQAEKQQVVSSFASETETVDKKDIKQMGWAGKEQTKRIKKPPHVLEFLEKHKTIALINLRNRPDAHEIAKLMKKATKPDGSPLFDETERHSAQLISTYYTTKGNYEKFLKEAKNGKTFQLPATTTIPSVESTTNGNDADIQNEMDEFNDDIELDDDENVDDEFHDILRTENEINGDL